MRVCLTHSLGIKKETNELSHIRKRIQLSARR